MCTGVSPRHPEESLRFLTYLMQETNQASYCTQQVAYPTLTGLVAEDPALEGLNPYFEAGRVATYSDHNFPPAVTLNAYIQQFLISGDVDALVSTLDTQWDKVVKRLAETA